MLAGDLETEIERRREAIRLSWQRLDEIPLGTAERHEASQAIQCLVADLKALIQHSHELEAAGRPAS